MAAEQAADLAQENGEVELTETIPQGNSAMLDFHPAKPIEENKQTMTSNMEEVKTGLVTYAVRDTKIKGITIKKGNFMGIADGDIKASHADRIEAVQLLLEELLTDDDEILTILHGEEVDQSEVDELVEFVEHTYKDIELEVYNGNQPIYSYILSVE